VRSASGDRVTFAMHDELDGVGEHALERFLEL
jgi:hypothetical protein